MFHLKLSNFKVQQYVHLAFKNRKREGKWSRYIVITDTGAKKKLWWSHAFPSLSHAVVSFLF